MAVGPTPHGGIPPRDFPYTYRYYQLAGHDPKSPWWATPLGVGIAVVALALILFLIDWLR